MSFAQDKSVMIVGIALAMTLCSGTALASEASHMAVLVAGNAPAHARELAASTIDDVARKSGMSLTKQTFSEKDAAALTDCITAVQPWSCVAPIVRGRSLQQLAIVSLVASTSSDGSPTITITEQVLGESLDTAIGGQRFCVRCTDDVLVTSTSELTRTVLQEIAVRSGRTVISISSVPRGARITFDGAPIGATDRSLNTFPGSHTVVLDMDGYQRETRSVETPLDRTSTVSVVLHRAPGVAEPGGSPDTSQHVDPPSLLKPKLVVGAGAAGIASGVVLLAFNQSPTTAPVGTKQPAYYYDTRPPGITLIIGGAAAVAGGLLWWRHMSLSTVPSVAPVAGGATVGVVGTF